MVVKNWRSKKMLKAPPAKVGRHHQRQIVLIHFRYLNRIKVGTRITWEGSMMVLITRMNRKSRPGARSREKPKATRAEVKTTPTVFSTVIRRC